MALLAATPADEQRYAVEAGVPPVGGEQGLTLLERSAFRPTIEVNGLCAGHQGPGARTIIPAWAMAKLTSRLVANQRPEKMMSLLSAHLEKHTPRGLRVQISEYEGGSGALSVDPEQPVVKRAASVLQRTFGRAPMYMWSGGSVPILSTIVERSGAAPLLVGFGLPEDAIHSPNESFSLAQFRDGFLYSCMMLEELSKG
jgi:acetylornithine deacetylase/succinyl-diaminopimelate desuccinylase-like protein